MTAQTQIYVARHEHGFVKIGKSDDPVSRIGSLPTVTWRMFSKTTRKVGLANE